MGRDSRLTRDGHHALYAQAMPSVAALFHFEFEMVLHFRIASWAPAMVYFGSGTPSYARGGAQIGGRQPVGELAGCLARFQLPSGRPEPCPNRCARPWRNAPAKRLNKKGSSKRMGDRRAA
jgi:hypothetical protein